MSLGLEVLLVCLVPVYALVLFLVLAPLVSWIQRRSCAKACVRTENFLKGPSFGLVTYICGNIGAGKTTCGAAIANVLSRVKRDQATATASFVREVFADVDFNKVDAVISLAFRSELTNTDAILNFLFDRFPEILGKVRDRFFDDGLYPRTCVSLLRDYVDAVVALERNRYVYFNRRKFYCWTTDTWAMDYTPEMIDMKDRFESRDWKVQRYTVIFEDEKVLSGKVSTNFQEVAREDGGGDSFLRLIRQLGKGTIHYISTAQDFDRIVKQERELATGVFRILRRKEVPVIDLRSIAVDVAYDVLTRWEGFLSSFMDRIAVQRHAFWVSRARRCADAGIPVPEEVSRKVGRWSELSSKKGSALKRAVARLSRMRERTFADGYVTYRGTYYTSAADVGKARQDCSGQVLDLRLSFPLRYCYGSTDTYAFSILNDYLSAASIRSSDFYDPGDHAIPREDDDSFERYFRSVLRKRSAPSRRR